MSERLAAMIPANTLLLYDASRPPLTIGQISAELAALRAFVEECVAWKHDIKLYADRGNMLSPAGQWDHDHSCRTCRAMALLNQTTGPSAYSVQPERS